MYLIYMDESEPHDRYQIVGGIILEDQFFEPLESCFGLVIQQHVPEESRDSFEFHASDLFHSRGPFEKLGRDKGRDLLERCADWIAEVHPPIIYGAVDTHKHELTIWGGAEPIVVNFRICMEGVEACFQADDLRREQIGLIVFDDVNRKDVKRQLQIAFRQYRKRVRRIAEDSMSGEAERGILKHIHDDLYFGDSAYSIGLQAADVCAYFINRHLNGHEDTEHVYKKLEPLIFYERVVPEG